MLRASPFDVEFVSHLVQTSCKLVNLRGYVLDVVDPGEVEL